MIMNYAFEHLVKARKADLIRWNYDNSMNLLVVRFVDKSETRAIKMDVETYEQLELTCKIIKLEEEKNMF